MTESHNRRCLHQASRPAPSPRSRLLPRTGSPTSLCPLALFGITLLLALPARAEITADQVDKLLADDGAAEDQFGWSVSVDGDTALVGARFDDDNGENSGSVYVFTRNGSSNWVQQAKLTPTDGAAGDAFGGSVSLDDDIALIGSSGSDVNAANVGAAYVFIRDGSGTWSQQAKLTANDGTASDSFGGSVSLDGDTALIGARFDDDNGNLSGSAYVFASDSNGTWNQQVKLTATDADPEDEFGNSVALHGNSALIGAPLDDEAGLDSGAAYVFTRDGSGNWSPQAKLMATDADIEDEFGNSVALDGDTALIGAFMGNGITRFSGSAYVFTRDSNGNWSQQAELFADDGEEDDFFSEVALDGDTALIGAQGKDDVGTDSGAAYVFTRDDNGIWTQQAKLMASDAGAFRDFGNAVALDGDTVLIGSARDGDDAGSAYVFRINGLTDDLDGDGILDVDDNCTAAVNPHQLDSNDDGFGDACVHPSVDIPESATVDRSVSIGEGTTLKRNDVEIGRFVVIGEEVTIKEGVLIARDVTVGDNVKLYQDAEIGISTDIGDGSRVKRGDFVGNNVTIGEDVTLERGVVVCDNATLGDDVDIDRKNLVDTGAIIQAGSNLRRGEEDASPADCSPDDSMVSIGPGTTIRGDVDIGDNVTIGENVEIDRDVILGDGVTIGDNVELEEEVEVGPGSAIGDGTVIKREVIIGTDVTIGEAVIVERNGVICDDATLGDGADIGRKNLIDTGVTIPAGTTIERGSGSVSPTDCSQ